MKHIIIVICLILSFNSNATLITAELSADNINQGDTLFIDVIVSDLDSDAAEIDLGIGFDNSLLSFLDFTFSSDVANSVFLDSADFAPGVDNVFSIFALWFDTFDVPSTNFTLGRLSFSAIADGSVNATVENVFIGDINGDEISNVSGVPVSAPNNFALFLVMAFAAFINRKRINK